MTPTSAPGSPEFRLSRRRAPRRRRAAGAHRRGGRHAVLLLFGAALERRYRALRRRLRRPAGAASAMRVKANSNLAVIRTLARLGAGADVVSEGEIRRALAAGIPPAAHRLLRRRQDARRAGLRARRRHRQINVESEPELEAAERRGAAAWAATAPVALRVNPDVDARTHAKITTGKRENKFGIDLGACRRRRTRSRRGAARHRAGRARRPYRLAAHRSGALRARLRRDRRAGAPSCAPTASASSASISAAASASAYRDETPPAIADYAAMVKRARSAISASRSPSSRAAAIVGNAGVLVAARALRQARRRRGASSSSTRR